jgi:anti-sigma factor RsiW
MKEDIENLLPWHAAGALSRAEARQVEEALANDPELARRFEMVRDEQGENVLLNESLGAPSGQAAQRLFAKINAEPARRKPLSLSLGTRVSDFLASFSPRTLAWSASAAALAIVLQAGIIGGFLIKTGGVAGFETASAPSSDTGTVVLMRFAPLASASDITQFLDDGKLQIVTGPMPGGIYRVRISATKLSKDELAAAVSKLESNKVVSLVATSQ